MTTVRNHPDSLRCHLTDTYEQKQRKVKETDSGTMYEVIYTRCTECHKTLQKDVYEIR